jgi:hypothetical protein
MNNKVTAVASQRNYHTALRRMGVLPVTVWAPEDTVSRIQRMAEDARLSHWKECLKLGDMEAIKYLATRNLTRVDDKVQPFAEWIGRHPDLIEGGPQHKKAVALYNSFIKKVQEYTKQQGAVSGLFVTSDPAHDLARAQLVILSMELRAMQNELEYLKTGLTTA